MATGMDKRHLAGGSESREMTAEKAIAWQRNRIGSRRNVWTLLIKIAAILLSCYLLLTLMFGIGTAEGEDMYPRIRDGDLLIYYRLEREFNIGDVIAFTINGRQLYGRIVGKAGDTVDITDDGQLVINGSVQQEEVFFETTIEGRQTELPVKLQGEEVFVLGDNRINAVDSRDFGPVQFRNIDGKVITLLRRRGL